MALCVVAYPILKAVDRDWIQAIRRQSDPQHGIIDPHFTLVFPTDQVDRESVESHLQACIWRSIQFRFVLRSALAVKDANGTQSHLFLVPDEGFSNLVRLHDRLYSGPLKAALNLQIPFIPHITAGAFDNVEDCKHAADILNQRLFTIEGTIEQVTLLSIGPDGITQLSAIDIPARQRPAGSGR